MDFLANGLIAIGALGFFSSTIGASSLAWIVEKFRRPIFFKRGRVAAHPRIRYSIDLLIAAHNEEAIIEKTLSSLPTGSGVRIVLGLDHCTDRTEEIALAWARRTGNALEIEKNSGAPSKWRMLVRLADRSDADWVAFVDAGAVWNAGLLEAAKPYLTHPEVIGVAPSYGMVREGRVDRLFWNLERGLKRLESDAGGPTSVHGATVLYRRAFLLMALEELQGRVWLNDDVVIPLVFRTLWPRFRIHYLTRSDRKAWVEDHGAGAAVKSELGRRERMLIGNLQWIRELYGRALRSDLVVGLVATRRAARVLWAYWALALLGGSALKIGIVLQPPFGAYVVAAVLIALAATLPLRGGIARIRSAFFAGLEAPFFSQPRTHVTEKIWN